MSNDRLNEKKTTPRFTTESKPRAQMYPKRRPGGRRRGRPPPVESPAGGGIGGGRSDLVPGTSEAVPRGDGGAPIGAPRLLGRFLLPEAERPPESPQISENDRRFRRRHPPLPPLSDHSSAPRLKCGEFLLLLIGHVNGRQDQAPLATIHDDIRQLLGEKSASLIQAASQFGSTLDPEQRQTTLHI